MDDIEAKKCLTNPFVWSIVKGVNSRYTSFPSNTEPTPLPPSNPVIVEDDSSDGGDDCIPSLFD